MFTPAFKKKKNQTNKNKNGLPMNQFNMYDAELK